MILAVVLLGYLAGVLGMALWVMSSRDRLVRSRLRDDLIVTMRSGEAFRGVLVEADARSLVLRNAKALTDSSPRPVPVDGELILDREQVDYMQRP
jgi:small nuclear ribonucleoprotein (snRNP)-like protein